MGVAVLSEGSDRGLVTWIGVALLPNIEKLDLPVSTSVVVLLDCVCAPKMDGVVWEAGLLAAPKMEGVSVFAGCASWDSPASSISSIASAGLALLGDETISSNEPPKENAPPEGLSGLGPSLAAVPSPLKVDPRAKPPGVGPKGFFTSVGFEGAAKAVLF